MTRDKEHFLRPAKKTKLIALGAGEILTPKEAVELLDARAKGG